MVIAHWSGRFPHLCSGEWTLIVNGVDVSMHIPDELIHNEMNTYGVYEEWYFDDNYLEHSRDYEDGLGRDEWIKKNKYWLDTITDNTVIQMEIYNAINDQDWRHGSCGGCI